MKMRVIRNNVLFAIGLALMVGLSTALASGGGDHDRHRPKDTGILTIRTSPIALTVVIDDVEQGKSGVGTPAEFYLPYGFHKFYLQAEDGIRYQAQEYEIRRGGKVCICLKI